ncbi:MAG: hypothetical protein ABIK37_05460 [candidate division WOR-3 bacterium]
MNPASSDCLPVTKVIEVVAEVESVLEHFYETALERISNEDASHILTQLRKSKRSNADAVLKLCDAVNCGIELVETPSGRDLEFLSTLVQSAFYGKTGAISELLAPELGTRHLVENALKLERDLMLFYLRLYAVSCQQHRPLLGELIRRGENDLTELGNLRIRLLRDEQRA